MNFYQNIYVEKVFYKVVDLESFKDINYHDDLKRDKMIEDVKDIKSNQSHKSKVKRRNKGKK